MLLIRELKDKILRVTGEKAATMLSGQFAGPFQNWANNESRFQLYLTIKGKILAALWVTKNGNSFDLIVSENDFSLLKENLSRIAPLSRCTIKEIPAKIFHLIGGNDGILTHRVTDNGRDIIFFDSLPTLQEIKNKIGAAEIMDNEWTQLRHQRGIPEIGKDTDADTMPQECGLLPFIDFKKGCYLGQEVVARLFYRGHVNRVLSVLETQKIVSEKDEVTDNKMEKISNITSVAHTKQGATTSMTFLPLKKIQAAPIFFINKIPAKLLWHAPEK